ncbi:MAG: DUF4340 domain-containing protein [Spirochaetes bacterium]|nr:DUF4340 domain-containing protein [Spirochaetota bacterium]
MKRNIIICMAIIAILVTYIVVRNRGGNPDLPELPTWEGSADEIVIRRPADTLRLFRNEGKWRINEEAYPADAKAVQGLEKTLREISLADLVSEKGIFDTYELTPGKGIQVTVRQGGETVRDITFGKKSPASQHVFVRLGRGREVYMASGGFDSLLESTVEGLRDKNICAIPRASITGLTFTYRGRDTTFALETVKAPVKKDGKAKGAKAAPTTRWVFRGRKEESLNAQRMSSLLAMFDPLRATGFSEVPKTFLSSPLASARVKAKDGEVTVSLFKKGEEYLAVSSEQPYVFIVNEWTAKKFFIEDVESFR